MDRMSAWHEDYALIASELRNKGCLCDNPSIRLGTRTACCVGCITIIYITPFDLDKMRLRAQMDKAKKDPNPAYAWTLAGATLRDEILDGQFRITASQLPAAKPAGAPTPTPKINPPQGGPSLGPRAARHAPPVPVGPVGPAMPQQQPSRAASNCLPKPVIDLDDDVKPIDYKTHWLIGLSDEGSSVVVERWAYAPSQKEIDARIKKGFKKHEYVQFAVANAVGLVSK